MSNDKNDPEILAKLQKIVDELFREKTVVKYYKRLGDLYDLYNEKHERITLLPPTYIK